MPRNIAWDTKDDVKTINQSERLLLGAVTKYRTRHNIRNTHVH